MRSCSEALRTESDAFHVFKPLSFRFGTSDANCTKDFHVSRSLGSPVGQMLWHHLEDLAVSILVLAGVNDGRPGSKFGVRAVLSLAWLCFTLLEES